MLKSFWSLVKSLLMARQRPQLTLGIAILLLACGLIAACSTGTPTSGSSTSSVLPSVTASSSSTSTSTGTGSTPNPGATLACTPLNSLVPVLQAGKLHITFEMSAGTNTDMKGSITSFHDNNGLTMSGQGYLVSPNDPVQIQIVQTASSVQITAKNTTTGQATTYVATNCSAKGTNDIELTGTVPTSFTLDILSTP